MANMMKCTLLHSPLHNNLTSFTNMFFNFQDSEKMVKFLQRKHPNALV